MLEVFTPIPNLEQIDVSGKVSGNLDVPVASEPIDFFRIRNSFEPVRITEHSILTEKEGRFSSGISMKHEEIIATSSGQSWKISPTGIFEKLPSNFSVKITPASIKNPMSIDILDASKTRVYQQFMSLPQGAKILDASILSEMPIGNLYITPQENMQIISASYDDVIIPNGAYIINSKNEALLIVARDGNIYTAEKDILLEYSVKENYIQILARKSGKNLAEFWYKIDFFYTTK